MMREVLNVPSRKIRHGDHVHLGEWVRLTKDFGKVLKLYEQRHMLSDLSPPAHKTHAVWGKVNDLESITYNTNSTTKAKLAFWRLTLGRVNANSDWVGKRLA